MCIRDRMNDVDNEQHYQICPSIFQLSSGELALISIFGEIIHQADNNKNNMPLDKIKGIVLIDEIEKQAAKHDLVMDILLQVNIAKEESKHGFNEEEMNEVMDYLKDKPHLNPRGLMMMAPNIEVEETRQYFKATKDLLTKLQESYPNYQLTELSMGMTHDFPIAVAEGSTMVRLGHALFDE